MSTPARASSWAMPVALTLAILAARVAAVPALSDPIAGSVPESLQLSIPPLYFVLGPAFTLWDGISMLSMTRLSGFLVGIAGLFLIWRVGRALPGSRRFRWLRELGVLALSLVALFGFLLLGALWHRPMLSLAGVPDGDRVVDFHSHTRLSHDVAGTLMQGFDSDANLSWHARAGFDAVFITDHNVVSRESRVASHSRAKASATVSCPGIEVSAWRAHIVLLGDTLPIDRGRYNGSLNGLLDLLRNSESEYGSLSIASLPEYRRNHWQRLDTVIQAGLDGFEIVNASPTANELTRRERDTVVGLARSRNRVVVGVSDAHGWGATSMVWNLVRIDASSDGGICRAILDRLRTGFHAVRIVERHRLRPDAWWPMWLTPIGVVWESWRSMGWALTISWLLWIWLLWLGKYRRRMKL